MNWTYSVEHNGIPSKQYVMSPLKDVKKSLRSKKAESQIKHWKETTVEKFKQGRPKLGEPMKLLKEITSQIKILLNICDFSLMHTYSIALWKVFIHFN